MKALYGTSCQLTNTHAVNVASILATHERHSDIKAGKARSLNRWHGRARLVHPAVSWGSAFGHLVRASGCPYGDVIDEARRRQRSRTCISEYRAVMKALAEAEPPLWQSYLEARVRAKGWDATNALRRLRCLPRTVPQAHLLAVWLFGQTAFERTAYTSIMLLSRVLCVSCNVATPGESCSTAALSRLFVAICLH